MERIATDSRPASEIGTERSNTASGEVRSLSTLIDRFTRVRDFSSRLCSHLEPEDFVVQSMPDASPLRWHLAHTTWFFETFVLKAYLPNYRPSVDQYTYMFNSYYNAVGDQFPRAQRGTLSRPTMREVWGYRESVDRRILQALSEDSTLATESVHATIELGLNHEQQHQELMLTDIQHAFYQNPIYPSVFLHCKAHSSSSKDEQLECEAALRSTKSLAFHELRAGLSEVGTQSSSQNFAYDNEGPPHTVYTPEVKLANRTVTNAEYLQFIEAGGYRQPEHWLSEGWAYACQQQWQAPLYWQQRDGQWFRFTLSGLQPLVLSQPVVHISYFEADAYARWSNCRLPTEFEWEVAANRWLPSARSGCESRELFADQLLDSVGSIGPQTIDTGIADFGDMLGNVWEWTSSSYAPYPGYCPSPGAIGEYNGKFMCNQYVLRGGSCATSSDHIRATYRNFFPAHARWQFSGLRCAQG